MNLHMYAKFGANRPSGLIAFPEFVLRLVRLFAAVRADSRKNTPKNNIYTSKIIFPAQTNMQTSTSLTFFTAIFVAFSGALAEELMIFCRHVRTESILLKETRVCVCVCKIGPISARTVSIRLQSARKFGSHSNFPMR